MRQTILIAGAAGLLVSAAAAFADHQRRSTFGGARQPDVGAAVASVAPTSTERGNVGDDTFSVLVQRTRKKANPAAIPLPPPPPPIPPGPEAVAVTDAACARAFHEDLTRIGAGIPAMSSAVKAMRAVMPGAPGRLLFSRAGLETVRAPRAERVCVERVIKRGKERCVRWESRAVGPAPLARHPKTAASPEEVKLVRAVEETIRGKGSLIEFGGNGRYTVMSDRFAMDMRGYLGQPFHPALCSGAPDLIKFYSDTLGPLRSRLKVVTDLTGRARAAARARVAVVEGLLTRQPAEMTPAADDGAPAAVPPPPRSPAAETVSAMIALLAETVAPRDTAAEILAREDDLARLAHLQAWLGKEASRSLAGAERESVLVALRSLEIGAYVEGMQRRYRVLDEALLGTLSRLREAEQRSCTCGRP